MDNDRKDKYRGMFSILYVLGQDRLSTNIEKRAENNDFEFGIKLLELEKPYIVN